MKITVRITAFALMPLCVGMLIYIFLRPGDPFFKQWFHETALVNDASFLNMAHTMPQWILFSLPDGLWMFSMVLIIFAIWDFKLHRRSLVWLALAIVIGLLFELGQAVHLVRGHFDPMDLVLMLFASLIPIIYIRFTSWMQAFKGS